MHKVLATNALKDASSAHKAFSRWITWCDGLTAAKSAAGLFADDAGYGSPAWIERSIAVERTYTAINKRPPMPAKSRKYKMYDAIYRAADLAGVSAAPGSIGDLPGVARVIAEVTAALVAA